MRGQSDCEDHCVFTRAAEGDRPAEELVRASRLHGGQSHGQPDAFTITSCHVTLLICNNLPWDTLSSRHISHMYVLRRVQRVLQLLL